MDNKITLSASRVKQFLDCSWLFYHLSILKLPDKTHPKTKIGSLTHIILECLCNKRHKKNYDIIVKNKSIYADKSVSRLVKIYLNQNPDITPKIAADLNKLVFVALNHDFFFKGAKKVLEPEYKFEIDFGSFQIKGFMDRAAIYDKIVIIKDFKTQSKAFSDKELEDNLQSLFYQTAIKSVFGLPSEVQYIMLRHGIVQKVAPHDDNVLNGFKFFLKNINDEINNLTLDTAKNNLKATKDIGFCNYVCNLKKPFSYYVLLDKDRKQIKSDFVNKFNIKNGETIEERKYNGCWHFFTPEGKPRNFN